MNRRWFEQLPINGWDALQLGGRLEVKEAVEEAVEFEVDRPVECVQTAMAP